MVADFLRRTTEAGERPSGTYRDVVVISGMLTTR